MAPQGWIRWIHYQIWRSNLAKLILASILICIIYIYYNSHKTWNFSSINETYRKTDSSVGEKRVDENGNLLSVSKKGLNRNHQGDKSIDVIITFTKADNNYNLQQKFRTTVMSMFKFTSVPINIHILGDEHSEVIATRILSEVAEKSMYKIIHENVEELAREVGNIITHMQSFFSYKPGAYFSDTLFFISLVSHRVLPHLDRVIMLDCDLKFNADLKMLNDLFDDFSEDNIIGIGRELQPVYRHALYMYRKQNKGTRVGEPAPDGLTGFNSGVLLLDLEKMRKSDKYNALISDDAVKKLTQKYQFKGHLGDQDFFTLISFDHEELFYVIPCTWNRQLCQWWKNHGYSDIADQYFVCEGHINIYHGNCNTEIPKLDWEN